MSMLQKVQVGKRGLADSEHPLVAHVYIPEGAEIDKTGILAQPATEGFELTINGDGQRNQWKPGWNEVTFKPSFLTTASLTVDVELLVPEK